MRHPDEHGIKGYHWGKRKAQFVVGSRAYRKNGWKGFRNPNVTSFNSQIKKYKQF